MNQFLLQQGISRELQLFSHIIEFALKKNNTIQLNSLHTTATENLRIYYIIDGKFEWLIHEQAHILYPGDVAMILPGQKFGGGKGFLDIGTLSWISIKINKLEPNGSLIPGKWSSLSEGEAITIGRILLLNQTPVLVKLKEAGVILENI